MSLVINIDENAGVGTNLVKEIIIPSGTAFTKANIVSYVNTNGLSVSEYDIYVFKNSVNNSFAFFKKGRGVYGASNLITETDLVFVEVLELPVHTHTYSQITDFATGIANKVDKVTGKGLSENDFTTTLKNKLDAMTATFTTTLKTSYDSVVTWISANGTNVLNHLANISNPHSVTKTQVGLGNVDNTSDASKPVSTAMSSALALKVDIANIINDVVTGGTTKVLSAEQGKVLKTQIDAINTILTSDNVNLDSVQEIVDAIEAIQSSGGTVLVNDLTTGGVTKALTAEQGVVLKGFIDTLTTAVGLNTSKVTNATHTGEVTGSTALTITDGVITVNKLATSLKGIVSLGNVSGAVTIDCSLGIHFNLNMIGATSLNITNPQAGKTITLVVTGNFTLTQPSSVKGDWSGFDGTKTNQIQIYCIDSATPIYSSGLIKW